MVGQEPVELRQLAKDVFLAAPRETAAAVHQDFFGGEPFDSASETERAVDAGESAEAVAEQ